MQRAPVVCVPVILAAKLSPITRGLRVLAICWGLGLGVVVPSFAETIVNGVRPAGLQPNLEYTRSWYYPYDSAVLKDFLDFQLSYKVEAIVDMLKSHKVAPEGWYEFLMKGDFVDREKTAAETRVVIRKTFNESEKVISAVERGGPLEDIYLEHPAVILLLKVTWAKIQIREWAYQAELYAKLTPTESQQSVRTISEPVAGTAVGGSENGGKPPASPEGQSQVRAPASINAGANLLPGGASGFASSGAVVDVAKLRQEAATREKSRKSIASQGAAKGGQASGETK
jgi:hypothetical protein